MPRPQDELSRMMQVVWKPLSSWLDTFVGEISFIPVIKGKPCTLLKAREAEVEFVQRWFSLSFKSKSSICQRGRFGGVTYLDLLPVEVVGVGPNPAPELWCLMAASAFLHSPALLENANDSGPTCQPHRCEKRLQSNRFTNSGPSASIDYLLDEVLC